MEARIYYLQDPVTDEIRYVGQTTQLLKHRLKGHIYELNRRIKTKKTLSHKDNWLKQLKDKNRINDLVICLIEACSLQNVDVKEKHWIQEYRSAHPLTNIQDGGQKTHKHTEETKKKISRANSGAKNGMYGKRFQRDAETIERVRRAMVTSERFQKSRKSKAYRDKISKLQSRPVLVLDENLETVMEFPSCTACAEHFGFTRGNIKIAVRNLRQIGKSLPSKFWVVRKDKLRQSIDIISSKTND